MPTYLYCLLADRREPPKPGLTGVAGEPVRALPLARAVGWVGTVPASAWERSAETARRHDAVVMAAMDTGATPLPARAGQVFADDDACAAEMTKRSDAIRAALERVEGCVEMTVHVSLPEPRSPSGTGEETPETGSMRRGRAYMQQLRERTRLEQIVQAEAANARERVVGALAGLARAERAEVRSTTPPRLVISHLISRDAVPRYREALADVHTAGQGERLFIGGPYAPYSFASIGDA